MNRTALATVLGSIVAPATLSTALADDSAVLDLTGVVLRNATNQSRSSAPDTIDPAPAYLYAFSENTMVRGTSGALAIAYPNPTPLADILDSFEPGSSEILSGFVENPAGTHPFVVIDQRFEGTQVISGITVTFAFDLEAGIDAANNTYFSITNVTLSPAFLVGSMTFTSGTMTVTRTTPPCLADWDGSGGVDGDDIGTFFADWQAGNADIDGSGGTDGDDITFFFARWQAGC